MKKNISRKCLTLFILLLLLVTSFLSVSAGFSYEKEKKIKKQSFTPGDYFRFIIHDFRIRTYRIHIPPCYTGDDPLPVILILHGHPSNGKDMQSATELDEKADKEGFIAVYPDGEVPPFPIFLLSLLMGTRGCWWNAWGYNRFNNVDDVDFIRVLIRKLQEEINIDSSRIYVTGLSGGALMTYRLGAELSDIIAAIAPVAGSVGGSWVDWFDDSGEYIIPKPSNPLPVIVFHGMKDLNVPYEGGWVEGNIGPFSFSVYYLSVDESVSFWVDHNNCNPEPEINESGNVIKTRYIDGDSDSEVVLYTVKDGAHEWFGSPFFPDRGISINNLMWEFFERHPKQ
jgi:polyhydroxybutyrate depolymerase